MNWARNQKVGIFLSFWMLWSTVGIKLYLEYCACHEAIQASLFAPDASCPSGTDLVMHWAGEGEDHIDESCCKPVVDLPAHNDACCQAPLDSPGCPPGGCDSQDVQEFKVTTPFLLSVQDWPVFSPGLPAVLPYKVHVSGRFHDPFHSSIKDPSPAPGSGRQSRILFQSFQC